ncbi:hypothetical protein FRX31_004214 [Thalictrum thalictroides]|nr:hypothetical protein FRX31_004214 [Thalictrum thalictroides]
MSMSMASRCAEEGWKVAIPLLSPLILSPASPRDEDEDQTVGESLSNSNEDRQMEVNPVFMTWKHPAAPFCYDSPAPSSVTPPFVHLHQCR